MKSPKNLQSIKKKNSKSKRKAKIKKIENNKKLDYNFKNIQKFSTGRHLFNYRKNENSIKKLKNSKKKGEKYSKTNKKLKFTRRIKKSPFEIKGEKLNYQNNQSQTILPFDNGKIRIKYIFHDEKMELNKKNRDIRENKNNIKEIDENCDNCICNINQVILYLSNIMRNRSDILDKIENYKCHLFIDIGNEIFLTDNSQIDVIQGHIRRNLDESHGLKYIDSENVEDTLKQGIMSNNGIFFLICTCFSIIIK